MIKVQNITDEPIQVHIIIFGSLHMVSQNQPFDFEVLDNSGLGIDPFKLDDFSAGRCSLYVLERDDMVSIRYGAEV